MRKIQEELKGIINEIDSIKESIAGQLDKEKIDKDKFDDLLGKIKKSKDSLEKLKNIIAEKLNDW